MIFTSGATEANMLALTPSLGDALFVSAIEHPSVRAGGRFDTVTELPVTGEGVVDLGKAEALIAQAKRPLVSLMLANNETGIIQPVRALADIVHRAGGLLHVDAVQAPGRMAVDMAELGADMLTISSHKLGGPQGAGALIVRADIAIKPLIRGGGQERNRRAGTENVAAIAGFGVASSSARSSESAAKSLIQLRDRIETGIRSATPHAVIFGGRSAAPPQHDSRRCPGHERRDGDHRLRSRWHRAVLRSGLLIRQSVRLTCACGDECPRKSCEIRAADQFWPGNDRK